MFDEKSYRDMVQKYDAVSKDAKSVLYHNLVIDYLKVIEKQLPHKVKYSRYQPESDSHCLVCPNCYEAVGSLDNEDGDGIYKSNIYVKHCPSCGQKIQQIYTEEDYKTWGI